MNTHYIVNTEERPLQVTRAIRSLLIMNPHYIVRKEDQRIMAMLQINLDTNSVDQLHLADATARQMVQAGGRVPFG